jgi:hypothetical protein
MDEKRLAQFLKKDGRSESVQRRCVAYAKEFESFLKKHRKINNIDDAKPDDLAAFTRWDGRKPKPPVKLYLWGIRYYYKFSGNKTMAKAAAELREGKIKNTRKVFPLKDFRGISRKHAAKLAEQGIANIDDMLKAGAKMKDRKALSKKTGVPEKAILEFVKLSDLARIPGVKNIRARLYYDAGIDSIEKMAKQDPDEMREMLIKWVAKTGFDGIAPLPKEVKSTVETARKLKVVVEE